MDDFVAYVGPPEIHDGVVEAVEREGDQVRVLLRGGIGRPIEVVFRGVESVTARRAEGMVLYALAEMRAPAPLRRFVFANWEEEDDASLEVIARELQPEGTATA